MFRLFVAGGPWFMAILTILFAGICFAAWKAPRWVKEIGLFALAFGLFSSLLGLIQAFDYLETNIECSKAVIYAGMKVMLIPFAYGILIYLVSLVVRICQKPKA